MHGTMNIKSPKSKFAAVTSESQPNALPKKERKKVDRISKAHFKMKKKETQLDQENAETKHAYKKI